MLRIDIPKQELWDEGKNEFVYFNGASLVLEHSLVAISKWESKYHKPFITNKKNDTKTREELLYYVKCMTITQNVKDEVYGYFTPANFEQIRSYMDDPMTATTITSADDKNQQNKRSKPITSEQVYCWMISRNIPIEFQKWHINRLLMLIRVLDMYNGNGNKRKRSKHDLMTRNTALNAARRKQLNTTG